LLGQVLKHKILTLKIPIISNICVKPKDASKEFVGEIQQRNILPIITPFPFIISAAAQAITTSFGSSMIRSYAIAFVAFT
jgi:hypothetical protein